MNQRCKRCGVKYMEVVRDACGTGWRGPGLCGSCRGMPSRVEPLYQKVLKHFDGDHDKVKLWFHISNPELRWMTPSQMWLARPKHLEAIVDQAQGLPSPPRGPSGGYPC